MNYWNTIVNPLTGRKVLTNGKLGFHIITKYFKQLGGAKDSNITKEFNEVGFKSVAKSIDCYDFNTCCKPYLKMFIKELGSISRGIFNFTRLDLKDGDIRVSSKDIKHVKDLYKYRSPAWIDIAEQYDMRPILDIIYKQVIVMKVCFTNFKNECLEIVPDNSLVELQGYHKNLESIYTDSQSTNLLEFINYYNLLLGEIIKYSPDEIKSFKNELKTSKYTELIQRKSSKGWKYFIDQLYLHNQYIEFNTTLFYRNGELLIVSVTN